eukprot:CCRYP_009202-RA/>CCRYP_009202-RA protein AED:0.72 eAED:0.12 QI:0/-1/0/1/-1/1/1/0/1137
MKVNGIPFLMTISRHIKFGSAGKLDNMSVPTIISHFKVVIGVYASRGFRVTVILADNQFEPMRGELANLGAIINVVSHDEHVPEIERFNRTIKERVRAAYNVLPFEFVPPVFIIELVYAQVFWRNMFAIKGGISHTQSPSELILNRKLDFNAHCKVEYGEYVQTHEEHDNSMGTRTVGAIATRPTGNTQGGYYFIRLDTGRRINRRDWTTLPMPDIVIDQVHRLARRAKANRTLAFTNIRNEDLDLLYQNLPDDLPDNETDGLPDLGPGPAGVGMEHNNEDNDDDEDEDDSTYNPTHQDEDNSQQSDDQSDDESTHDDESNDGSDNDNNNDIDFHNNDDNETAEATVEGKNPGVENEAPGIQNEIPGVDIENTGVADENAGVEHNNNSEHDHEQEENEDEPVVTRSYQVPSGGVQMNLRNQPRRNYDVFNMDGKPVPTNIVLLQIDENMEMNEQFMDEDEAEWLFLTETLGWKEGLPEVEQMEQRKAIIDMNAVTLLAEHLFRTDQMGWRKGLKIFHKKGEVAIENELRQIHDMEGFQPKHWHELTKEERARALRYLMYLKEKRDGKLKGRGCADGRPQRVYTPKSETSSPTAALAAMIMTCVIDAHEGRDAATLDIPGAFLQTKMPKDEDVVHVVLDGRMAELLAKISPETYQEYVHHKREQAYIYCQLNVALYGTLKAAVLFWRKLLKSLRMRGFTLNPYDWCVANKMINGKQLTILWHVDDLKISHVETQVVDEIIASLKAKYEKVGTMTVRRGKIHEYLGMTLDFSQPGKFIIGMENYIDDVLKELPDDMAGTATTPAAEHLFRTRDNATKLNEKEKELFHKVTAQLLYACKRGRPDVHTAIAFLCTRVKHPDKDDYKKLTRVIKYLRRTKFLRLTMEAGHLDQNHWFIDSAFAVHDDMRSHSGSYMTFGKGMMGGSSNKQKINTTSSTEAETVAVHDNMPNILWTRYFLAEQGYPMRPSIIHQDNQSAMLLETNGRGSSSKRTRHMNIRYFFVADCKDRGHVTIRYCPTDEMIGDFFTKPLGGAKFRRFRNIIMNCDHDEYGAVDMGALMSEHQKRIAIREQVQKTEHTECQSTSGGSQECVGPRSDPMWAAVRIAHKGAGHKSRISNKTPSAGYTDIVRRRKHTVIQTVAE